MAQARSDQAAFDNCSIAAGKAQIISDTAHPETSVWQHLTPYCQPFTRATIVK